MPLWFGGLDADFSKVANLADIRLQNLVHGDSPKWFPAAMNIDDGGTVTEHGDRWKGNALGPVQHARQRRRVDALHLQGVSVC